MFKLNLLYFKNDVNYEDYSKFLKCLKSERGSLLHIKQQQQLRKFIKNHKEICQICKVVTFLPQWQADQFYHYSIDSKFLGREQINGRKKTIGISDLEKDQMNKTVEIKNKINCKGPLFVQITSDNTTLLVITQTESRTHVYFHDLLNENFQDVKFENCKFITFWKIEDVVFILLKKNNVQQLYQLLKYKGLQPILNIQRIFEGNSCYSFISHINDQFLFFIQDSLSKCIFKKNLKPIIIIQLFGLIQDIRMLVSGILIFHYHCDGSHSAIKIRQTWSHKQIRQKILQPHWSRILIYQTLCVFKNVVKNDLEEYEPCRYSFQRIFNKDKKLILIKMADLFNQQKQKGQ